MTGDNGALLARLPSIERLLSGAAARPLIDTYGRPLVADAFRAVVAARRDRARAGLPAESDAERLVDQARRWLERIDAPGLRPVLNLTGTVLHTNLGRAPLPPEAIAAIAAVAGATNLEYDLDQGRRGERDAPVEARLCRLTGAAAATVVNNNAAALLLVLGGLARRKEVLVSRGELVEIGGSFRLPEIMAAAGCRLREVGTTNRTHLADYAEAVGPRTGLILKVHTSNYRIQGFTAAVEDGPLAALAARHDLPYAVDLGSGSLIELTAHGLPREPSPQQALAAGAALVTFSGDKLLGGPQSGIILGDGDLVARLRRHPLKRALRVDKLTLAALDAVLRLYGDPARLVQRLPALRLLVRPTAAIEALARAVLPAVQRAVEGRARVEVIACRSQIGSGALPLEELPSVGLRIVPARSADGPRLSVRALAAGFRRLPVPVIGRIEADALILDLRCLEDPAPLLGQLAALDVGGGGPER